MQIQETFNYLFSKLDTEEKRAAFLADETIFKKTVYDFFEKLNFCILRCDFIKDINSSKSEIEDIKRRLKELPTITPDDINDGQAQENIYVKYIGLKGIVSNCLSTIEYLLSFIEKKFKFSDIGTVFIIGNIEEDETISNSEFEIDENILRNYKLFHYNISVLSNDFGLKYDRTLVDVLTSIQKEIRSEYSDILYSKQICFKANFLVHKIFLRTIHTKEIDRVTIQDGSKEYYFDIRKMPENKRFHVWSSYIKNHYQLNKSWELELKKTIKNDKIDEKSLDELNYFQIHRLIKFYKDILPNIEKITEIRQYIQSQYNQFEKDNVSFDKYANAITLNYVANNEFSLFLEQFEEKFKNDGINKIEQGIFDLIDQQYKAIIRIQEETDVKNFFPQFRLVKFLSKIFKGLKDKKLVFEKIEVALLITSYLDENSTKYLKHDYQINVDWTRINYNLVFQMPFNDCKLLKPESDDYLFVASSFILPLDREYYLNEFDEYEIEINNLKNSLDIFNIVHGELLNTKEKIGNKISEEIKNNEIRNIELLGIFTAFLALISASINSLDYIDTAKEGLIFTLAIITSIPLFVLIILSVTRENYLKSNQTLIRLVVVAFIIAWTSTICLDNGISKDDKTKLDSTNPTIPPVPYPTTISDTVDSTSAPTLPLQKTPTN